MPTLVSTDPTWLTFLREFGRDVGILFLVSLVVHGVAMAQMFSAAHGNAAAWEPLRAKLLAIISSAHVLVCSNDKITVIQPSLLVSERDQLSDWVRILRQVEQIQTRLAKLRRPYVPLLWFAPSVAVSAILTSPILYGSPPFLEVTANVALMVALFQAPLYFLVTQRHAAIWSAVHDMAARSTERVQGATLAPLPLPQP